jgi:hypothetical protein
MPKVHKLGPHAFAQVIYQPLQWGNKIKVKGWTQEIEHPYRFAAPLMVRLPFKYVLVLGKWQGTKEEEDALNSALLRRDVTYDDFTEEAGWLPPSDEDSEKDT